MNSDLRRLVHDRLSAEDLLQKNWSSLVLAACDGDDALAGVLNNGKAATPVTEKPSATKGIGAYLTSLAVEGFRGIGPRQTLTLTAGPGLTIIVGRNGSGTSSFAEALEVLLTSDNKRWAKGFCGNRSQAGSGGRRTRNGKLLLGRGLRVKCAEFRRADQGEAEEN